MSRSFGDWVASSVGVSSDPEILAHSITSEDKFIILASDGVWEFMSNSAWVKTIGEAWDEGNLELAWDKIYDQALALWKRQDDVVDDITFIIVFLTTPIDSK